MLNAKEMFNRSMESNVMMQDIERAIHEAASKGETNVIVLVQEEPDRSIIVNLNDMNYHTKYDSTKGRFFVSWGGSIPKHPFND